MNDRAILNMLMGGGVAALGAAATVVSHASGQPGSRLTSYGYGAIAAGSLQLLLGIYQAFTMKPEPIDQALASLDEKRRVVAGALAFHVRDPAAPSANEIAAIRRFVPITPEQIRETTTGVREEIDGIIGFLARNNGHIDPDIAAQIVRGTHAVMNADGPRDETADTLSLLGRQVFLSEAEIAALVKR